MQVRVKAVLTGAASFLPVLHGLVCRGTGGTVSARYCYSVWLRHVVRARQQGLNPLVHTLAELGPGDSLGIGLAAMLCGVDVYLALDAKAHAVPERNLGVLAELLELFRERAPVPGEDEFPAIQPKLDFYAFPAEIVTDELLAESLRSERLAAIRRALEGEPQQGDAIRVAYIAPWEDLATASPQSVDMAISQAVMEHVEDIPRTYQQLYRLLKPGGIMSHNIDFRSHGLTRDWNGHWTLGESTWRVVRGTRPYLINRHPYSAHRDAQRQAGFRVLSELRREGPAIDRGLLSPMFSELSDQDLTTTGALILSMKPNETARRRT